MKKISFLLLAFTLLSCLSDKQDNIRYSASPENEGWHKITFDDFSIEVPKKFKYQKQNSYDSFVGKISDGNSELLFDYGYYSESLIGEQDYVYNKSWLSHLPINYIIKPNDSSRVEVERIWKNCDRNISQNNCNYFSELKYEDSSWIAPIEIPISLQGVSVEKDTISGIVYEISQSNKDVENIGIRVTNLKNYNPSMNTHKSLVIKFERFQDDSLIMKIIKTIILPTETAP